MRFAWIIAVRIAVVLACLTLANPGIALSQPAAPPPLTPGTGLIVGQVMDAATGKGVNSSIVTLAGSRRVLTTASGHFVFDDLPEGSHTLTASKSGYIDGAYGARRAGGPSTPVALKDGERVGDIVIKLWRYGSVGGTVVDEMGEPLVGVQITALRRTMAGGQRRFVQGGTGGTDDRGMYRISRLIPGDYVVAMMTSHVSVPSSTVRQFEEAMLGGPGAAPNPLSQGMAQIGAMNSTIGSPYARQVGDHVQTMMSNAATPPPADGPQLFAYPSAYFPAATSATSATVVTVGSAQERTGIDLQVKPVPTARVSGMVVGASGPTAGLPVRLVPQGGEDLGRLSDAATITDSTGAFTFVAVPSGDYTLRIVQVPRPVGGGTPAPTTIQIGAGMVMSTSMAGAPQPPIPNEPTMWASVPISVANTELSGINVVLKPGLRINGKVEFDGAAERPTPAQMGQLLVLVEPVSGQFDRLSAPPGRVDGKGFFTTYGFVAGKYFVRVPSPPAGWTFKGAMLGDRNLSDSPLELESGDVSDVVLTFTDRPSSLSGTVQMTERAARDGVVVVAFPADSKSWADSGLSPRRLRRVGTTDSGSYTIGALPAGAYYAAAIPESAAADWMDPAFLESLANDAAHVQIDEGEKAVRNLPILEIR